MSSVVIAGDVSGSVTLQAPSAAGTTTLNLPTVSGGTLVTSDSSGNVGIGTASPAFKLDVQQNQNSDVVVRVSNSNSGSSAKTQFILGNDTNSTISGLIQNSSTNTAFGGGANSLNVYQGYSAPMTFMTNTTERMRISSSGNVGIGVTNPTSPLHVSGTANITGNGYFGGQLNAANSGSTFDNGINLNAAGSGFIVGTGSDGVSSTVANVKIGSWDGVGFAASISGQATPYAQNAGWISCRSGAMSIRGSLTQNASDKRLKENFEVIPNALEKIASISGYTFDWKIDKCFNLGFQPAQTHEHGVIAQEIKEVIPDAVTIAPFDNECGQDGVEFSKSGENYLTVNIQKLIPLLLQGIKEQQVIINDIKAELAALKGTA